MSVISTDHQKQNSSLSDALHQLVCLLAVHAAREWFSKTTPTLNKEEPNDGCHTTSSTSDH